jgi:hypothetical protein
MAIRGSKRVAGVTYITRKVAAGQSATRGLPAQFAASDAEVQTAGAGSDAVIGIFDHDAAAGEDVLIALYGPVIPVRVGTGGATRGTKVVRVADGFTNAPAHSSAGATDDAIQGIFMESGVANDFVGMQLVSGNRGSA